ncbi:hypothetical protein K0M31_001371 [Melipona bicolor]|uniref:Uncharacterized protein n=1 Tax=Melipona bicolor TaxID=60889 RepID=A0AA40KXN2_9HYME|nr:hypothetical protein K0M31_001371 [Melipona bicolor]
MLATEIIQKSENSSVLAQWDLPRDNSRADTFHGWSRNNTEKSGSIDSFLESGRIHLRAIEGNVYLADGATMTATSQRHSLFTNVRTTPGSE